MKRLFTLLPALLMSAAVFSQTLHITYEPLDSAIANPERGLDRQLLMGGNGGRISATNIRSAREDTMRRVTFFRFLVLLNNFKEQNISQDFLTLLEENLGILRQEGAKCALRFKYSDDEGAALQDASLTQTLKHIAQLKPILKRNADVIALLEAGFIGTWGEWGNTTFYKNDPSKSSEENFAPRKTILRAMLDAIPKSRFVSVRTPNIKMSALGITRPEFLTAETAYDGSMKARLGAFNDGFLWTADDGGTFGGDQTKRRYWEYDSRFSPMGGEAPERSLAGGGHEAGYYTSHDVALAELKRYHYSYLEFGASVRKEWDYNGVTSTAARKLGYRFVLTDGQFTEHPVAGKPLSVSLNLLNDGWAAPYLPHDISLVLLKDGAEVARQAIDYDLRFLLADQTAKLEADLSLPADLASGNYDLCLAITDPEESIKDNPLYNIRLANAGTWLPQTGLNHLCTLSIADQATGIASPATAPAGTTAAAPAYDLQGRPANASAKGIRVSRSGKVLVK